MSLTGKKILILLGGMYHDFEGFGAWAEPLFTAAGGMVESTFDLARLVRLDAQTDLVVSYTSLSLHPDGADNPAAEELSVAQIAGLRKWVQRGGGLLGIHSATVAGRSSPEFGKLWGGVFVEHPPQFDFTVYPLHQEHPITAGIGAFTVHDEFYMQRMVSPVELHMVAIDRGQAHPMVWSRDEGQGKVACIAMGHSAQVWKLPQYCQLTLQAAEWTLSR
jgi:type 1 glutamine amidotransferase